MKIFRCDVCRQDFKVDELHCLIIYKKGASRKAGTKAENSKDICSKCLTKTFGAESDVAKKQFA